MESKGTVGTCALLGATLVSLSFILIVAYSMFAVLLSGMPVSTVRLQCATLQTIFHIDICIDLFSSLNYNRIICIKTLKLV